MRFRRHGIDLLGRLLVLTALDVHLGQTVAAHAEPRRTGDRLVQGLPGRVQVLLLELRPPEVCPRELRGRIGRVLQRISQRPRWPRRSSRAAALRRRGCSTHRENSGAGSWPSQVLLGLLELRAGVPVQRLGVGCADSPRSRPDARTLRPVTAPPGRAGCTRPRSRDRAPAPCAAPRGRPRCAGPGNRRPPARSGCEIARCWHARGGTAGRTSQRTKLPRCSRIFSRLGLVAGLGQFPLHSSMVMVSLQRRQVNSRRARVNEILPPVPLVTTSACGVVRRDHYFRSAALKRPGYRRPDVLVQLEVQPGRNPIAQHPAHEVARVEPPVLRREQDLGTLGEPRVRG